MESMSFQEIPSLQLSNRHVGQAGAVEAGVGSALGRGVVFGGCGREAAFRGIARQAFVPTHA